MLAALKALGLSKEEREEIVAGLKAAAEVYGDGVLETLKGGPGSGHHGHQGVPGQRGGSAPGSALPRDHADRARLNRLGISKNEVGFAEVPGASFVEVRGKYLPEKYHPFVTPYSAKEYRDMGAKTFVSESGKSGYALRPDGDIISVFSSPDVKEGSYALMSAIANGGSKLDCFDGFLAQDFYPRFGFEEYDRWKWDDQYAPEEWDYEEFDRPDVVFMRLSEE